MNLSTLKTALLVSILAPFLMACPKPKTPPTPDQDMELQSSKDVSYATFLISDIEMICANVGVNDLFPRSYTAAPISSTQAQITKSPGDLLHAAYFKTKCMDGRLREGTVFMKYDNVDPNATYYQNYDFHGQITLSDYRVDGWQIKTVNGTPCEVHNLLNTSAFDPSKTNLSWSIEGSFEFTHPSDPSKNMIWTGKLVKTLVNTSDPAVFKSNRPIAINWSLAKVAYSGYAEGYTSADKPFKLKIDAYNPLMRDFSCFPDKIGGVRLAPELTVWNEEFHPFVQGIAAFTTGDQYPRQIYYGNEGSPDLANQCNNSGEVLIKGNSYPIDFMK